jgi:hypothetical protein
MRRRWSVCTGELFIESSSIFFILFGCRPTDFFALVTAHGFCRWMASVRLRSARRRRLFTEISHHLSLPSLARISIRTDVPFYFGQGIGEHEVSCLFESPFDLLVAHGCTSASPGDPTLDPYCFSLSRFYFGSIRQGFDGVFSSSLRGISTRNKVTHPTPTLYSFFLNWW